MCIQSNNVTLVAWRDLSFGQTRRYLPYWVNRRIPDADFKADVPCLVSIKLGGLSALCVHSIFLLLIQIFFFALRATKPHPRQHSTAEHNNPQRTLRITTYFRNPGPSGSFLDARIWPLRLCYGLWLWSKDECAHSFWIELRLGKLNRASEEKRETNLRSMNLRNFQWLQHATPSIMMVTKDQEECQKWTSKTHITPVASEQNKAC